MNTMTRDREEQQRGAEDRIRDYVMNQMLQIEAGVSRAALAIAVAATDEARKTAQALYYLAVEERNWL